MPPKHTEPTADRGASHPGGSIAANGSGSGNPHMAANAPRNPSPAVGGKGGVQGSQSFRKPSRTRVRSNTRREQAAANRRSKPVAPWKTDSLYPQGIFPLPERKRLSIAALAITLLFNFGICWFFFIAPENNPLLLPKPESKPQQIRFVPPFVQTNPAANQEKIDTVQEGAQNQRAAQEADPDPASRQEGPQLKGEDPRFNRIVSGNPLAADAAAPTPTDTDDTSDSTAPQAAGSPASAGSAGSPGRAGSTAGSASSRSAPSQRRGNAPEASKPVAVLPSVNRTEATQQPTQQNAQAEPTPQASSQNAPAAEAARHAQAQSTPSARPTPDSPPAANVPTGTAQATTSPKPVTTESTAATPAPEVSTTGELQLPSATATEADTVETAAGTNTKTEQPTPAEPEAVVSPTNSTATPTATENTTVTPAEEQTALPVEAATPSPAEPRPAAAAEETPPSPLKPTPSAQEATAAADLPTQVLVPEQEQPAPPVQELEPAPLPAESAQAPSVEQPAQVPSPAVAASAGRPGAATDSEGIDPQRPRPRPTLQPRVSGGPRRQQAAAASRRGVVAIDSKFSEFGAYQQRMVEAISQQWYLLAGQSKAIDSEYGTQVVLRFKMNDKGIISDTEVRFTNASAAATLLCINAVESRSPFGIWNSDMKRTLGDEQSITFTFYYR